MNAATDIDKANAHFRELFNTIKAESQKIQNNFLRAHVEVLHKYGVENGRKILARYYELKEARGKVDANFDMEIKKLRGLFLEELRPRINELLMEWKNFQNSPEPTIEDAIADLKL